MTLPTSGPITMTDIKNEFGVTSTPNSLKDFYGVDLTIPNFSGSSSNYPTIKMSDFYNTSGPGSGSAPKITKTSSLNNNTSQTTYTFSATPLGATGTNRVIVVAVSINSLENSAVSISGITLNSGTMVAVTKNKGTAIFQILNNTLTTANIVITLSGGSAARCVIDVYSIVDLSLHNTTKTSIYSKSEQMTTIPGIVGPPIYNKNCIMVGVAYIPSNTTSFVRSTPLWVQSTNVVLSSSTRHLSHYVVSAMSNIPESYLYTTDGGAISYSVAAWR